MKVLMIGSDLAKSRGGVTSVVSQYFEGGLQRKVSLHYIASHSEGSLIVRIVVAFKALLQVFSNLLVWRPDIVHLHVCEKGSFFRKSIFAWITSLFRISLVLHMHSGYFPGFVERLAGWMQRYVRATLRLGRVVALTNSWAEYYATLRGSPEGIWVLANPILVPSKPYSGTTDGRVQVLTLGKLTYRKGSYDLVEALALLKHRDDWIACLAGHGDIDQIRQKVAAAGIAERVSVPGWLSQNEVRLRLSRPTIFCLASYAEGLPMSVLEAMAYGHPVVATPVGGIPDIIKDTVNGYLVPPGDPGKLAHAISDLLDKPGVRELMGKANRVKVETENERDKIICQLVSLYERIIQSRPV